MGDGLVTVTWVGSALGAGVFAGLAGALAMAVSMGRHPEGWTPAFLTAALVRRTAPEQVTFELASAVHHVAGGFTGLLYGVAFVGFALVVPWHGLLFGFPFVPHVLAVTLDTLVVYGGFAHLLFPHARRRADQQRETAIRGQWLRSSLVYAATVTIIAPLFLLLLQTTLTGQ